MSLIFLRHTRPDVPDGTCYGRTDIGLAPGFEETAGHILRTLPDIDHIVSSPLMRCRLLANAVATRRNLSVSINDDLAEMDFGAWENSSWNAIPRAELDEWAEDFLHARPHNGESVAMLQIRVRRALKNRSKGVTLWVSHGGLYRALLAETEHPDPWNAKIGFGQFDILNIPN